MRLRLEPAMPRFGRLFVLLQAALLAFTLVLAPELHRHTCTGVCASGALDGGGRAAGDFGAAGAAEVAGEPAAHSCCHGGANSAPSPGTGRSAGHRGPSSDGCDCLDDCCTIYAHGTTPDVVTDTGPATLLVSGTPEVPSAPAPRAPGARLLPYPTGPPSAA